MSGPELADRHEPGARMPTPRRWAVVAAAFGAGIGTGLLGTSLHGHALYGTGYIVPLGAVAALVMLAAVELFVGLWGRSAWVVVLCGGAAYLCAGLLSLRLGAFGMISANLQGNLWLYGIAVLTPVMAWIAVLILRPGNTTRGK
ncbi:N-acetyl-1-D-myo-inositol-2-amino-2-deoxy-alpha-D-glucopyranoside deacetylase [Arthrobacter silviterrae]|uniref:Histidinol dehydrogenase n=1 Tax=Arthrobacter silviterrae TaxID=2026658 RepID=A0ABX0DAH6_9MICC|nr:MULTISPECIES: hypothetical protein [Arthrobacter]MCU6479385.1 hypothetical protein [Arthrobacter sp. A2-55]MDQ0277264.1 N-acetyl-1-D-myo-inositol-2-amino-2-deoxy-alpha-D-glucopyranoside deacetylase [Arthrobacter silviterrae]NGN82875.1 hypothetical protein [Arthrobacter silviterrae]